MVWIGLYKMSFHGCTVLSHKMSQCHKHFLSSFLTSPGVQWTQTNCRACIIRQPLKLRAFFAIIGSDIIWWTRTKTPGALWTWSRSLAWCAKLCDILCIFEQQYKDDETDLPTIFQYMCLCFPFLALDSCALVSPEPRLTALDWVAARQGRVSLMQ